MLTLARKQDLAGRVRDGEAVRAARRLAGDWSAPERTAGEARWTGCSERAPRVPGHPPGVMNRTPRLPRPCRARLVVSGMAGGAGARWPGLLRPHALETTTVPDLWRRARRLDAGLPPWRRVAYRAVHPGPPSPVKSGCECEEGT